MSEVDRYGPTCDCMSKMSWGDYVKASDYDQLKEQLWHSEMAAEAEAHRVDELKAENARMSDMITLVVDESNQHRKERDTLRKQLDEAREVIKEMRYACTNKSEAMADAWLEANK